MVAMMRIISLILFTKGRGMRRTIISVMFLLSTLTVGHMQPAEVSAEDITGITCVTWDYTTTRERSGVLFWEYKLCWDYLSVRTGIPPVTFGDAGTCDEGFSLSDVIGAKRLDCDWRYNIQYRHVSGSYRDLFCLKLDSDIWGYDNRYNIGYIKIACTSRTSWLRAF
jgi:hypothetical protein